MLRRACQIAAVLLSCCAREAGAGVIELAFGSPYTQNFDSLAIAPAIDTDVDYAKDHVTFGLPQGWDFLETGSGANPRYNASTGSATAGDTYSLGSVGSSERALGALSSGNVRTTIGFNFENTSGMTIESLEVAYSGEQWRFGETGRLNLDTLAFAFSTDATSLSDGNWTAHNSLDYSTQDISGTAGARNGNSIFTNLSSTIAGLNLADGQSMWFRWVDTNIAGSDDALAIDNFSLSAEFTVVPEPSTLTIYGVLMASTAFGAALKRRRAKRAAPQPA